MVKVSGDENEVMMKLSTTDTTAGEWEDVLIKTLLDPQMLTAEIQLFQMQEITKGFLLSFGPKSPQRKENAVF